jgi:hypothetical protein
MNACPTDYDMCHFWHQKHKNIPQYASISWARFDMWVHALVTMNMPLQVSKALEYSYVLYQSKC